jgi:hypothetical protein
MSDDGVRPLDTSALKGSDPVPWLIAGVLLPPFAWLLDMQVSYSLVKWACATHRTPILFMMPIFSLTLVAVALWMSWSSWHSVRRDADQDGGRAVDRSYLLALAGMAMSALFAALILVSLAPRSILSPCE